MGMTATERLRALLDERGVEYRFNDATKVFEWHFDGTDGEGSAHATEVDGGVNIMACSLTPEQAIAATLGLCNCSNGERTETCRNTSKWANVFECSMCGFEYDFVTDPYQGPHFCPNCGRRIEVDDG